MSCLNDESNSMKITFDNLEAGRPRRRQGSSSLGKSIRDLIKDIPTSTDAPSSAADLLSTYAHLSSGSSSKSGSCGLTYGSSSNSCKRRTCPSCAAARTGRFAADVRTAFTHHEDLVPIMATLTIRSVPGRSLADQWESLRSVAAVAVFAKWLKRNTEGVFWSDGLTVSGIEPRQTWNVHRHYLLAVPRALADKIENSLSAQWLKAAEHVQADALLAGQEVRGLGNRADVWPVAEYIADQFALDHLSKDGDGSYAPGQLLARAFLDDSYDDIRAFVTIERAMPRQTIRASGVFAPAHVRALREAERDSPQT